MSHVDNIKFRKYFIIISEQALFHVRFFNIVTRKKTPKLGNFLSLTLFRMGFFRAAHRWGGGGGAFWPPLTKICHRHPAMTKLGSFMPYLRKIQKMYKSRDTSYEFS